MKWTYFKKEFPTESGDYWIYTPMSQSLFSWAVSRDKSVFMAWYDANKKEFRNPVALERSFVAWTPVSKIYGGTYPTFICPCEQENHYEDKSLG